MTNVIDAGEALANSNITTTWENTNEEIDAAKETLEKMKDASEIEETIETKTEEKKEEVVVSDEEVTKDMTNEEEPEKKEDDEPEKEEQKEEEEEDEDEEETEVLYIKRHPEEILKLIKTLEKEAFNNKDKQEVKTLRSQLEIVEWKYKELQKQKYDDKYDDANLPVLEEKRGFWRSQNKFYSDSENEANRIAYIKRLEEELDDVKWSVKSVSIDNKEKENVIPEAPKKFNTLWRVGVSVQTPRR